MNRLASSGNSLHWHKGRGSWESAGCQVPSLPQSSCGLCWLDLVQCGRSTCVGQHKADLAVSCHLSRAGSPQKETTGLFLGGAVAVSFYE